MTGFEYLTPLFLENESYPGIHTYIPGGSLDIIKRIQKVKPMTFIICCCSKVGICTYLACIT